LLYYREIVDKLLPLNKKEKKSPAHNTRYLLKETIITGMVVFKGSRRK
jgi:hypothetical protein